MAGTAWAAGPALDERANAKPNFQPQLIFGDTIGIGTVAASDAEARGVPAAPRNQSAAYMDTAYVGQLTSSSSGELTAVRKRWDHTLGR